MSSLFQNANYIGNNISAILYGIELIVYGVTVYALWTKPKRGRSDTFFFCFSTSLLILLTIFYSTDAVFGEEMYVVNANYPGGMDAYLAKYVNVWYQTLSTASPITANLLGDGLMIYRCYIIYNNVYIIVIPSLIWLGTFAAGILLLYASGNPNGNFFGGFAANCGLAYYTTEISLNFITTVLIIGRLLWISRYMGRNLGPATSETYVNAIAIVVESALPYTICGIVYLVTYGVQSDISVLFLAIYGMMTGLSPQLIIMRVVKGRATTILLEK
ncbi:hypothetical protein FOMPIDRAFT_81947 [Fomitopsis schrenkii]|uniref:Uncharacterized protein n=1 Tax=Fomitopsis schrenkii TaxID=2126942 RepID=S8DVP1_FOMSC|nr:hypothetical protein FOMPIDRAFT_81947 [Fomitopsis schrenkii]